MLALLTHAEPQSWANRPTPRIPLNPAAEGLVSRNPHVLDPKVPKKFESMTWMDT
jgi:hypothetical protein